jgi:uncharacterized protein YfaS (alpha-2-macroglobulin family)
MNVFSGGFWLRAAWIVLAGCGFLNGALAQSSSRYSELQREAAGYYSEQSYALAHQAWAEAAKLAVPEGDRRTLDFYLADSLWRSRPDAAQVAEARKQLATLADGKDTLAAEATESLGDSWLALENDWSRAWTEYQGALKYWAAATDLEPARGRYLGIVWKATGPPTQEDRGRRVPLDVLANALLIAPNADERARAHFFIARTYAWEGDPFSLRRAGREYQAAVEEGSDTAVYEAALFALAQWNLEAGTATWTDDGRLDIGPDYDRALELFRRFVQEFPSGKSAHTDQATAQIAAITQASLDLAADQQFLPGAKPVVQAHWRNVGEVQFTLSRVDLARDFAPTGHTNPAQWLDAVRVPAGAMVRQWADAEMKALRHAPHDKEIELGAMAEPGTYLLEASGGGRSARALIVVTEGAAIVQTVGDQTVAFFCEARTGERAAVGGARLWRVRAVEDQWRWQSVDGPAAKDGLVVFPLPKAKPGWSGEVFVFGKMGSQPVLARAEAADNAADASAWRIQVFTDRAAYRPGDVVRWKLIARKRKAGAYATPGGELLKFVVTGPRGAKVDGGEVKLTPFGGAWGELSLRADLPLGEYTIEFRKGEERLGGETLFRLEDYRLPEFKVEVAAAGEGKGAVRLGDEFAVKISAEYYFGGAVADARVAVEVREEPFVRPLPFGGLRGERPLRSEARVVKTEAVRTSPDGTAVVRVPTPLDGRRDLRYTITARVVDSSGREVIGTGSLVVARQGYFVTMRPSRRIALPKDRVNISLEAKNGDERPVAAAGVLTVSRERWTEVWLDPQGREVTGEALDKLKRGVFPPPGEAGWRLKKQEYVSEEVARTELATNAAGRAGYSFEPEQGGFYRIAWSGRDGDGPPVTAETNVWVSASARIGYHSGGVEVIVDPEAPAHGGKVPVMVTTDTSNRDVLLLVHAGDDLFRADVLHLDGDSKLVELENDPRFVPNVFVTAAAVRGLEFFTDTQEVKFPPFRNTLAVELRPDGATSLPGADGTLRLAVKNSDGEPVRGEFAVAVTDEAISAIQEDYTGSPVDFFFGEDRPAGGSPSASMSRLPFFVPPDNPEVGFGFEGVSAAGGMRAKSRAADGVAMAAMMMAPAAESAPVVTVRSNFSATAFWQPGIVTDENGEATVHFKYPDSLTTWRALVRGATTGAAFGFAKAATRTTKPLIARLQAPRFLVAGDQVEISGVVNNRTAVDVTARTELTVEGLKGATKAQTLNVPANGDARAAWRLQAPDVGNARLTLTSVAGDANDGTTTTLPVEPNGIEKAMAVGGKAIGAEATWKFTLPAERRAGSESLVITATPSLAAAALDALPYLVRYPYGCVEQTMSRFLPAAVTARTLQSLGLDRSAVARRIYGGIEPEFLAQTHPATKGDAGLAELNAAIDTGLARLRDFQRDDGAWGWWKGEDADPFMTAYVVWGLRLAQQAGVAVRSDMLKRANAWLRRHLVDANDDPNLQAWLLHALAVQQESGARVAAEDRAALANLWGRRDQLTAYGRALLALAAWDFGEKAKAQTLARNLHDGVIRDAQPGVSAATGAGQADANSEPTAHWGSAGMFRRWEDGGVEATAFALEALLAIEPESDLVEPAMNWLVKNRRAAQWSNTRDTAIVVLAMDRYLAVTKQLGQPASFEILVNGKKAGAVTNATALAGQSRFEIDRGLLRDGENEIALKRTSGNAPIYLSAQARFFTLEQPIPAAGNELFVKREYFRFDPRLTLLDGYRFDRLPWPSGEAAAVDQRVEVGLTIEAKNDLEYVLVEDLKPAGLEAEGVRSGEFLEAVDATGRRLPVYCELRDRKVAFFLRKLPQGVWTLHYELRTETAGDFSALPVMGQAMYAPEIRGNGESRRVTINAER